MSKTAVKQQFAQKTKDMFIDYLVSVNIDLLIAAQICDYFYDSFDGNTEENRRNYLEFQEIEYCKLEAIMSYSQKLEKMNL